MKAIQFMLTSLLLLGLGACATNQQAASKYPPDLRSKYINAIEQEAATRATRVYWVKAPTNQELAKRLGKDEDSL